MADGKCIGCGTETKVFASSGRRAKWCSKPCRLKHKKKKPLTIEQKARANERQRAIRVVVSGTCLRCGSEFSRVTSRTGRRYGKYCSQSCNMRYRMETGGMVGHQFQPLPPDVVAERQAEAEADRARLAVVAPEVLALKRIARWKPGGVQTVRPCTKCAAKAIGYGNRRRLCPGCKREKARASAKPSKRIYKAWRRAIERGVDADRIDPIKVFERDRWTCHICGAITPRSLRGSYDDRAPELDHVVPLACGGTHTWGNVRCSCRKCNGMKADKPLGQLALDWAA